MISLTSPVRTRAHGWPAGAKLAGLCLTTLALFFFNRIDVQLAAFLALLVLYALPGKTFFRFGMARLRMLWPFILVMVIWHLATSSAAEGAVIILRMMTAVGLANIVTMTTRLSDMIEVVRRITSPLRFFGVRTRVLEIAIALVIRLTPVLLEKGQGLTEAWAARSARRATWRIILPFTVVALDDADRMAEALAARGGLNSSE